MTPYITTMAQAGNQELTERFITFYRNYYREEIAELAQQYPNEQRSLYVDYDDIFRFDHDLAEDVRSQPDQMREYAEEALRLFDLPADVSLGQAHVRVRNLPDAIDIRGIRVHDNHIGKLVAVQGIIRKATDVRPKITEASFECQRCGTMTYIPQTDGEFQEPHECQGCERQGPFRVNFDQSEFIDSQKLRIQESPEGLRGGETPQSIDADIVDDLTGKVTPGDHVTVTGVLHIEQQSQGNEMSSVFDLYMDGVAVEIEDEEFEDMDINEDDVEQILELSAQPDIYDQVISSVAPSIYGYEQEKLAMVLQLFSGVTKRLPDGSRTRGDFHMLLIGDPGTGKCVRADTEVQFADGSHEQIGKFVERHLESPSAVDDGVYDDIDVAVSSVRADGSLVSRQATRVWKREAPSQMYQIRTAAGATIEVTPSHPLFVPSDRSIRAVRAAALSEGMQVAAAPDSAGTHDSGEVRSRNGDVVATKAGGAVAGQVPELGIGNSETVVTDRVVSIEAVDPDYEWVYDIEVEGTHSYLSEGLVSHNSALLQYVRNIAPRSVYTSGKGSSAAGLTAAAVQSDFGEGQQWTLEAGALVLADKGIAAVDELDKMRCVTGDTRVRLGDGTESQIGKLAREAARDGRIEQLSNGRTIRGVDFDVWTMTDDDRLVRRPVTAIHEYTAPDVLRQVRLDTGATLTTTADHPFLVGEGADRVEKPAADLQAGDRVCVPRDGPTVALDGGSTAVSGHNDPDSQIIDRGADVVYRTVESIDRVESASGPAAPEGENPKVYDLTVADTHNFVANGMVVHNSEDRSAMHEALEAQEISISKAGINATLKSRCSLLGAANPKYGRFDRYEPIAEQIDLEPALISRFDLIFTVTDEPDPEEDARLADHILQTNYAGELNTHREELVTSDFTAQEIEDVTEDVTPEIEADLLRKYIAYSRRNCYPTMTDEARQAIKEFYVDLRSKGTGEDDPVPVTARKLEALVRLSEASARIRLSDSVEREDADRVIEIVRSCLQDIGVDPETGQFDADVVETGQSKSQRDRIKSIKELIPAVAEEYDEEPGAPVETVIERADEVGISTDKAEAEIDKLRTRGEVYEPKGGYIRTT